MRIAVVFFDIMFILIFWFLHLMLTAFTTVICWVGGDCPDALATFLSQYHLIDMAVTSLILFIAIRGWKAVIEMIAEGETGA